MCKFFLSGMKFGFLIKHTHTHIYILYIYIYIKQASEYFRKLSTDLIFITTL